MNGLLPGQTVYLRGDMGDVSPDTLLSVTVPHGTPAIISNFIEEFPYQYALLDIPTSPGQKQLRTERRDFHLIWQTNAPRRSAKQHWSFWECILDPWL